MANLLAIETNDAQASQLRQVADSISAHLTVVPSVEAAIAGFGERVPDVILFNPLMAPQDEEVLLAHLRDRVDATGVQTLITPILSNAAKPVPSSKWFGSRFRARYANPGCAPSEFAKQIKSYLALRRRRPLTEHNAADRRCATRVADVGARVLIDGVGVSLVDLSVGGAQIVSSALHVPGQIVPITIAGEVEQARCDALVVWGEFEVAPSRRGMRYRAGIKFTGADRRIFKSLGIPTLARV